MTATENKTVDSQLYVNRRLFLIAALVTCMFGLLVSRPLPAQEAATIEVEAETAPEGAAPAAEWKTLAVVAGASYRELISDVAFLGSLAGKPEIAQALEGGIAFFTQGKGLTAIDQTKPWGVILRTDGQQFVPIGCLPITKPEDLLEVAAAFGAQVTDAGEGVKQISVPDGMTLFMKQADNWVFIGQVAESLDRVPANPEAAFGKLVAEYDLAGMVSAKNVPEMYRQLAIDAMQSGMQEGLEQKPDETPEQFQERQELAQAQMDQVVQLIDEIDTLLVGWAIDSQQQRSYMDFTYSFIPAGKMSSQFAAMLPAKTDFSGFYQPNAVATMIVAQQVDMDKLDAELLETQRQQSRAMVATWREQLREGLEEKLEISDPAALDAIEGSTEEFLDAVMASMEAGKTDVGATLNVQPGEFTFVAGAYLLEPAKVENALRRLVPVVDQLPHINAIELNADTHEDVTFHRVTVKVPEDQEEARDVLGEETVLLVGIGKDAIYLAAGKDHSTAIKAAIDASLAEPGKSVPIFELAISLGPILATAAVQAPEDQREIVKKISDMLRDETPGRDHIRMIGQLIPNGLRYRIEAEEGVLRALGAGVGEAQRQAMEGQMQGQGF